MGEAIKKGIAPKSSGFVHKKAFDLPQDLNLKSFYLRDDYIESISKGLQAARIIKDLHLSRVGLNDKRAMTILESMNK